MNRQMIAAIGGGIALVLLLATPPLSFAQQPAGGIIYTCVRNVAKADS